MWRIRFCKHKDLKSLLALSKKAGNGMTSMPLTKEGWQHKIEDTFDTVHHDNRKIGSYFLVMEDMDTKEIVGTTAVYTCVGEYRPFYAFLYNNNTLTLTEAFEGAVEVGSLFISPEHRQPGLGAALAKSRYMLMKRFPGIFNGTVMAVCRGWLDTNDNSPFWTEAYQDAIGMSFNDAVKKVSDEGNGWLAKKLNKKIPVTDTLLPYISKAHTNSVPAQKMLERENFKLTDYVDVLDGGPMFTCRVVDLPVYRSAKSAKVKYGTPTNPTRLLLSKGRLNNFEAYIVDGEVSGNNIIVANKSLANTTVDYILL